MSEHIHDKQYFKHAIRRSPRVRSIDIHAHWFPTDWLNVFEKDGAKEGARLDRSPGHYIIRTGKVVNPIDEEFVNLELRLESMDRQGVDVQALSLTNPMVYWASSELGLRLSQAYNDAASAAHIKYKNRFVGLAMLPMQDPALALKELDRVAKLPGIRGLYLATNINGVDLDDKRFWDIYTRVEELGWTIFLHPVETIGPERTRRFFLRNLLGNPFDTCIAAACLIFGGVLDAFPSLEINLPHAGGAFPGLIGRLDHGTRVRPELSHMLKLPSEYMRRFTYDIIGHSQQVNMNLIQMVGADRILLGSDYCFDMGLSDPIGTIDQLDSLTEDDRDLILGKTAARLLHLD